MVTSSLAKVRQERVGQEARVESIQELAFFRRFIPCIPSNLETDLSLLNADSCIRMISQGKETNQR